jgi:arginyl-tRNA synthetase
VDAEQPQRSRSRLWLCAGTKQVIANLLTIIGVAAPESMERADG